MLCHRQHSSFSTTLSSRLTFQRCIKRLRKLLSMVDDHALLEAAWVIDWGRNNGFAVPAGYDFPAAHLQADLPDAHRINSWELETLLVEALGTAKRPGRRTGNPRSWAFFTDVISVLRAAENSESDFGSSGNMFRHLTRTMYRQFSWQARQQNLADVVRWNSIFRNPELANAYVDRARISPQKMIALGIITSHLFKERPYISHPPAAPALGLSSDEINAFFGILSQSLGDLRERSAHIVNGSLAYRESPFRLTPLVSEQTPRGHIYQCPLMSTISWRTTTGLYYDVAGYVRAKHLIGSEFESFQRRLVSAAYPAATISGDERYGPGRENKRTPDITVEVDGVLRLAFECKAKRLRLSDQIEIVSENSQSVGVQELAKGVFQLARFRHELRQGLIPGRVESADTQYVVLTLDDWIFAGRTTREDVFLQAEALLQKKGLEPDFDLRDILFCTAAELDIFVTRLSLVQMIELFRLNRTPEFRHHAAASLVQRFNLGRAQWGGYPLAHEFADIVVPADLRP